jgi:hypothetical protein
MRLGLPEAWMNRVCDTAFANEQFAVLQHARFSWQAYGFVLIKLRANR